MTTDHVLSETDESSLYEKAEAMHRADQNMSWRLALINAAYQLGIERGKAEQREFICARCGIRQDSKPPEASK